MKRGLFLLASLVLFAGCDFSRVFEENTPIENAQWKQTQAVSFDFELENVAQAYHLYFNLRNNQTYKYSNLYVLSELKTPSGSLEKDTLEFILADRNGKWLGKTGGALVTHQIMFQRNVVFPDTGTYSISFSQIMRDEALIGVTDVGFRLEKSE